MGVEASISLSLTRALGSETSRALFQESSLASAEMDDAVHASGVQSSLPSPSSRPAAAFLWI